MENRHQPSNHGKSASRRVYLHGSYEEWKKQRDKFLRARPRSFPGRMDETFAAHLLEIHSNSHCSTCSCHLDPVYRPMPKIPGLNVSSPPRLTPIKKKSTSNLGRNYPQDSSQSAKVVTVPQQDCCSASSSSGPASTKSSKSVLSDHTYIRMSKRTDVSSDLEAASSLPEAGTKSMCLSTPERLPFDPHSASTPEDKTVCESDKSPSASSAAEVAASSTRKQDAPADKEDPSQPMRSLEARRGLSYPPSRLEEYVYISEEDSESSDSENSDLDDNSHADSRPPERMQIKLDESYHGVLDTDVFNIDLGAEETVGEDNKEAEVEDEDQDEREMVNQRKCIVYEDRLLELLMKAHGTHCPKCDQKVEYRSSQQGTAMVFIWECRNRHRQSWTTQPRYNGMFAGNLQTVSAIVMSGNSFQKIATMAHFLKLRMLSRTSFCTVQKLYVSPAVGKYYKEKQEELLTSYSSPIVLSGDGRSDSPGYSATLCTYTLCDESTKRILHSTTVMMQEAQGKSPNMERIGFERALDFVMSKIEVKGVVTDAHPQIAATMKRSEKYQEVKHQWDVWHGSKNLVKKVNTAAQQKNCQDLQPWVRKISNHFWYSSQTCDGKSEVLAGNIAGVLHHIIDEHEWLFTIDGRPGKCQHPPLEDSDEHTAWLEKDSPSHAKLNTIIMDKRFLKNLHYYEDFQHTGSLELFHSTLLMYASKRTFFTLPGYCTRVQLAILDTNYHSERKQAVTKDGKPRWCRRWNKRTKRFSVVPVKEPKTYEYIPDLMVRVFRQRATTPGPLRQHVSLAEDDPRRIHPTIAMRPSDPTAQLVAEHKSRFHRT